MKILLLNILITLFRVLVVNSEQELDDGTIKDAVLAYKSNGDHSKYGPIEEWNTSQVTDMKGLFFDFNDFNADISNWDVSNVTNMGGMFFNAKSFQGDISIWNVSNVSDMNSMFEYVSNFNGVISEWDVSKVQNMNKMFYKAESFNSDINMWDVSNVTNMDYMFNGATSFNQDLCWKISDRAQMNELFTNSSGYLLMYPACYSLTGVSKNENTQDTLLILRYIGISVACLFVAWFSFSQYRRWKRERILMTAHIHNHTIPYP